MIFLVCSKALASSSGVSSGESSDSGLSKLSVLRILRSPSAYASPSVDSPEGSAVSDSPVSVEVSAYSCSAF
jgi:hypothetical protein